MFRFDKQSIFFGVADGEYKYVIFIDPSDNLVRFLCRNKSYDYNDLIQELIKLDIGIEFTENSINEIIKNAIKKMIKNHADEMSKIIRENMKKYRKFKFEYLNIEFYENLKSDYKLKYNILNNILSSFNYDNNRISFIKYNISENLNINKINDIGFYKLLIKQYWVYEHYGYSFIEEGKLIDIIRRRFPEYNDSDSVKSLELLYSICSLTSFNGIQN